MASPACSVKNGSGSYGPTANGVNVTPGNTISIQLASTAGVNTWSISCVYTDDLSVAATVTAGLTIDNINRIATFTAPVAGRAYIFQSQINSGLNLATQAADPTATTTFGIYTLTGGSLRVIASNETIEGNSTFGWAASLNAYIRNPAAAPSATTGTQGIVELAGDLAGNGTTAGAPLVSNVTGNTSGYATSNAPNGTQITGNPKQIRSEFPINIVTATTSATAIYTFATTSNRLYAVRGIIQSLNSPVSGYSTWEIDATAINNAGTLTVITSGGGVTNKDNNSGFSLTFTASGTNLVVTATDPVGGRRWIGTVYLTEGQF